MTTNETKGTLTFNGAELDAETVKICRAWLADALARFRLTEQAKTIKQTEYNRARNAGLSHAVGLVEVLLDIAAETTPRDIEIWNK